MQGNNKTGSVCKKGINVCQGRSHPHIKDINC